MSAELLRRAAKVLRDHATQVNIRPDEQWVNTDWLDLPTPPSNAAYEAHVSWDGDPQWSGIADACVGTSAGPYIALMHPPVALALADLLDTAAFVAEGNGLVDDDRYKDEDALARAILRES